MKSRQFVSPLVVCALGLALLWPSIGRSTKSQSNSSNSALARFSSLDKKALLAKSGDEDAVRQLAEEVVSLYGFSEVFDALPSVKERLIRAEISHRRKGAAGIPESSVAKLINGLADQLGAPGYAKVNVAQVRFLRTNLMILCPNVISQSGGNQRSALAIKPEMSPLEAVVIAEDLIYQKLENEKFQVTPEEWVAQHHEEELQKWKTHKKGNETPTVQRRLSEKTESIKSRELRDLITRAAETLGPYGLTNLADSSLDVLGIQR